MCSLHNCYCEWLSGKKKNFQLSPVNWVIKFFITQLIGSNNELIICIPNYYFRLGCRCSAAVTDTILLLFFSPLLPFVSTHHDLWPLTSIRCLTQLDVFVFVFFGGGAGEGALSVIVKIPAVRPISQTSNPSGTNNLNEYSAPPALKKRLHFLMKIYINWVEFFLCLPLITKAAPAESHDKL